MPLQVTLINHACVKIAIGDAVILCDPWLSGPAFNNGWDLLIKTPLTLDEVMTGVTHIWVSHEHPDHFVPKFFIDISAAYKSIPVLFQETRDRRVKSFIESRGFDVTELPDRREQTIGGVRMICGVSEFYDSWLHVRDGTHSVLNLNDCAEGDEAELREIAALTGPIDMLLTQFSYAAWKGGRANAQFREAGGAAQARNHRGAGACAEAAPRPAVRELRVLLQRGEFLPQRSHQPPVRCRGGDCGGRRHARDPVSGRDLGLASKPHDNAPALASFDKIYGALDALPLRPPGESVPLDKLAQEFAKYRERTFQQNSQTLIKLLRRLPAARRVSPGRHSPDRSRHDGERLHRRRLRGRVRRGRRRDALQLALFPVQQSLRLRHADGERPLRGDAGRFRQDDQIARHRLAQRDGACGLAKARDELEGGFDAAAPPGLGHPQHDPGQSRRAAGLISGKPHAYPYLA